MALPFCRSGVDGWSEQSILKTVGKGAFAIAYGAGNQADQCISQYRSCQFSTAQNVVANAQFQGDDLIADALVDAFVMAAQKQKVAAEAQLVDAALCEAFSVGCQVDDFVVSPLGLEVCDGVDDGLNGHDHSRTAAKRRVVDFAMFVGAPLPNVVHFDFDNT